MQSLPFPVDTLLINNLNCPWEEFTGNDTFHTEKLGRGRGLKIWFCFILSPLSRSLPSSTTSRPTATGWPCNTWTPLWRGSSRSSAWWKFSRSALGYVTESGREISSGGGVHFFKPIYHRSPVFARAHTHKHIHTYVYIYIGCNRLSWGHNC